MSLSSLSIKTLIAFLFYFNFSYSQLISGRILDYETQKPIEKVIVYSSISKVQTTTNQEGYFVLDSLSIGTHIIFFTIEEYHLQKMKLNVLTDKNLGTLFLDPYKNHLTNNISLSDYELFDSENNIDVVSGLLQARRDLFLQKAAFDFGAVFFKVKGYESQNATLMINNIPMNNLLTGKPEWSSWGGLNDIFRNQTFSYGFKNHAMHFGGLLSTTNILIDPATNKAGVRITNSFSNKSYTGRAMATYHSGQLNNDLSFSFSVSRRWGLTGLIDESSYNAYSLYSGLSYRTVAHQFKLIGIYTPTTKGLSAPITDEVFQLTHKTYNPYWGYQNGISRNSRIKKTEAPLFIFNYDFNNSHIHFSQAIAFQYSKTSSSRFDYINAKSPDPTYYKNLPNYYLNLSATENAEKIKSEFIQNSQIDWDNIYSINSQPSVGGKSAYILYDDIRETKRIITNSVLTYNFQNFDYTFGVSTNFLESKNYAALKDLLGGEYYLNEDSFSKTKNDVTGLLKKTKTNEKIKYHYLIDALEVNPFIQIIHNGKYTESFFTATYQFKKYQRTGLIKNERFINNSKGKSELITFDAYSLKSGLLYKISGIHQVFLGSFYSLTPPVIQNSFINARENNQIVNILNNEKTISFEINYTLRSPAYTFSITPYFTNFTDKTDINFFYSNTGIGSDFFQEVITNINHQNIGLELSMEYVLNENFKFNFVSAIAKHQYLSNPNVQINFDTSDQNNLINTEGFQNLGEAHIKGYHVPVGPQSAFSFGINYQSSKYWWSSINFNYLANNYISFSYITRTHSFLIDPDNPDGLPFSPINDTLLDSLLQQKKINPVFLINLIGGKSFKIDSYYFSLFIGLNNLFDKYYKTGGFEQSRSGNYQAYIDENKNQTPSFGEKYWHGLGRTYFINFALQF